jgi:XTP/dITP diphosphohydrolase
MFALSPDIPILIATSNPHKIEEIRAILDPLGIATVGLDALDEAVPEPVEDGATFAANARLKAIGYARSTGRMCLADDSGLCVDALGGAPGVYSARFAGTGESRAERDAVNNAKLLGVLRDVPESARTARFVCAMCLADASGRIVAESEGTFEGIITLTPAGTKGFGYDPLLYLPDAGCTSAQLSSAAKNARSHRGAATRALVARLSTGGGHGSG